MSAAAAQNSLAGITPPAPSFCPEVGAIIIGRNEGERLSRCIQSVIAQVDSGAAIVYVDSGSCDNSVETARHLGVEVVELDASSPFTTARGRNAGYLRLLELYPTIEFVQFIDGDCELAAGWIETARIAISASNILAVVCGRRRERHPEASVYNRLCDIEWDTATGLGSNCGGDALMRVAALRKIGLYDSRIIAAEDTELCVRLRKAGWMILRLDSEMTLHDAAITRLGQWWRRAVRAGHGFAENRALHGAAPARHWVREHRSNWLWGLVLPLASLAAAWPSRGLSLLPLTAYALLYARIRRNSLQRGLSEEHAKIYAKLGVLAKFPMALGQAKYWLGRLMHRRPKIIEYKPTTARVVQRTAMKHAA